MVMLRRWRRSPILGEVSLLQRLMLMVLRLVLVAVGAVLALAVLCGVLVLFMVWGVKRTWARLTGRPVAPWVLRTDPMAVWRQTAGFRRGAGTYAAADSPVSPAHKRSLGNVAEVTDVTDVTPK